MMTNPQRPNDIFPNFYTENNICKHCGTIIQRNFRAHVLFHLAKKNSLKNEFLYERVPEMNLYYFKCKTCQSLFHFHYEKKRLLEHSLKCKILAQNGMNREKNITELVKRHIKEVDEFNQTHLTEIYGVVKKRKMLIELVKRHMKEVDELNQTHPTNSRYEMKEKEKEKERERERDRERNEDKRRERDRYLDRENRHREREWEQESNRERRDWRKSPRDRSKERDRSNRGSSRESKTRNEKYATKGEYRRYNC